MIWRLIYKLLRIPFDTDHFYISSDPGVRELLRVDPRDKGVWALQFKRRTKTLFVYSGTFNRYGVRTWDGLVLAIIEEGKDLRLIEEKDQSYEWFRYVCYGRSEVKARLRYEFERWKLRDGDRDIEPDIIPPPQPSSFRRIRTRKKNERTNQMGI